MIKCFLLLILLAPSQQSQQPQGDLSPLVRPRDYSLLLDTNFDTWDYEGFLNVTVDVTGKVEEWRLHATEAVNIHYLSVFSTAGKLLHELEIGERQNAARDLLLFSQPLAQGEYLLRCSFRGVVSEKLTGYYRTGYSMEDGTSIKMASTHLSPDKARTVFPSFDEPQFRAKFTLTLVHPEGLTATSNMPVLERTGSGKGRVLTRFAVTPPMSTYLLAWVQHNFIYAEKKIEGVMMRHYARPGRQEVIQEKIALLGAAVKYFNNFFNIPYPLPKLDTIGIPNYLVGGMENWGLITLSEGTALSTPATRFASQEFNYRNLLAHEVSHMWFGNLVTMYWWNDLWLKEGMASYLSFPCVGAIYNDVDIEDKLMERNWLKAMLADNMVTSHPVQIPIKVTSQITMIFDSITYRKGATVLYMLEEVMGKQHFKKGMTHFLETYKYSIARYDGLMTSMTKFSEEPGVLRRFMDGYILQKNYPLIRVEKVGERRIRLTQARYVRDSGMQLEDDSSPFNYSWYIPISILSDTFAIDNYVIMKGKTLEVTLPKAYKWLKLNAGGKMMYVTHYSTSNLDQLLKAVQDNARDKELKTMSHRDRAHVLSDVFNLAQLNTIPYSRALEAAKYLREEQHYINWSMAYNYLKKIRQMIDESLAPCFRKYIVHLLQPQWREVLAKRDTLEEQFKLEAFIKLARYIPKARQETQYDQGELDAMVANYKAASEQERAGMSLHVETTDHDQITTIGNTLAQHPSTDVSKIIYFITQYSNDNPGAVWGVYKTNYKVYNDKYGLAQFTYADALETMIKEQKDGDTVEEIERFFKNHSAGAGSNGVQNGLEQAKFTAKFKENAEPELRSYLEKQEFCREVGED